MPTVSGFTTASPWCADALPACTHLIRIASGETSAVVGDADISASQRTLALAPLAAAAVKVRALVAVTGRSASAALQSSGGPGSAGWPLPPFTCPAFYLTRAFELPIRTMLDLDIPCQVGTCQHRSQGGTICGELLGSKGKHARSCNKKVGWVVKHTIRSLTKSRNRVKRTTATSRRKPSSPMPAPTTPRPGST
jgi:hypothetical protein